MTKTESAGKLIKTLVIESCEQWLDFNMAEGARAAIPNTNNLIMVGPQEWIEKNVPGVEALSAPLKLYAFTEDGMEIDNAHGHWYKKDDVESLLARLAATTQAVAVLRDAIQKQIDPTWECNSYHPALYAALAATTQASTAQTALLREADLFEKYFALHTKLDVAYVADSLRVAAGAAPKHDGFDPDRPAQASTAQADQLRMALQTIARWELPRTGKTWDDGTPMSYGGAFGSNGERDYMRQVALDALAAMSSTDAQAAAEARDAAPAEPIECWSRDEEDFNAHSLGELIDSHDEWKPGDTVWVGKAVHPDPADMVSVDSIIENIGEAAYDIGGEHAEDYPDVTDEQCKELETLVVDWLKRAALPTFYTVENIKPYVLTADDLSLPAGDTGEQADGGEDRADEDWFFSPNDD